MKRSQTRRLSSFVLTLAALLGLSFGAGAAPESARVGRELRIKVGRSVTFRGEDLRLRFVSVSNDSRCPKNVDCIWAGNAEVLVEVGRKNGRARQTLKLNTNAGPERPAEVKYGRHTVRLVGLDPYPRDAGKIRQSAYTATLLVVKE